MREAILAELGLMPLWKIRPTPVVAQAGAYVAIALQRDDRKSGWLVMDTPLTEDAASLLTNVLAAFKLQMVGAPQTVTPDLTELTGDIAWLWLAGVQPAQCSIVANMPVFTSVGLPDVVGNAMQKATLWADWCRWRF